MLQDPRPKARPIRRACLPFLAAGAALAAAIALAAPEAGKAFQDWVTRCERAAGDDGREQCFIVQNLVLKEGNQRVMLIAVAFPPDEPDPVAVLTLPLGISLPPGVRLRIDGGEEHLFAVDRCIASGCKVGFVLSGELLGAFKRGLQAVVTIHDGGRQPITLPVSLRGFTAALRSLSE
jgi:invasion protein IalB